MDIAVAARSGDVLFVLTTDESQPGLWPTEIAPGLAPGNCLCWASGYNVGYDLIRPPDDVDVVMVAPRMTGNMVRVLFERGTGALAQIAVHHDASGKARDTMLAICKGIGATRGGVFESSFREEAELDLFAEQILWAGLTAWLLECFKIGVEHGFAPELMVMEMYASGEGSEIMSLMAKHGFFKQLTHHSTTSRYGTLSRGPELLSDSMRAKARELFRRDIREGAFVTEWTKEQESGSKRLAELTEQALKHPISVAEESIIRAVQAIHSEKT
jgi:ketol-acid reductoisomerase